MLADGFRMKMVLVLMETRGLDLTILDSVHRVPVNLFCLGTGFLVLHAQENLAGCYMVMLGTTIPLWVSA